MYIQFWVFFHLSMCETRVLLNKKKTKRSVTPMFHFCLLLHQFTTYKRITKISSKWIFTLKGTNHLNMSHIAIEKHTYSFLLPKIVLISKYHNVPVPYLTMHLSEQKYAHFCSERCIVGYGPGTLWDLWDCSVGFSQVFAFAGPPSFDDDSTATGRQEADSSAVQVQLKSDGGR